VASHVHGWWWVLLAAPPHIRGGRRHRSPHIHALLWCPLPPHISLAAHGRARSPVAAGHGRGSGRGSSPHTPHVMPHAPHPTPPAPYPASLAHTCTHPPPRAPAGVGHGGGDVPHAAAQPHLQGRRRGVQALLLLQRAAHGLRPVARARGARQEAARAAAHRVAGGEPGGAGACSHLSCGGGWGEGGGRRGALG